MPTSTKGDVEFIRGAESAGHSQTLYSPKIENKCQFRNYKRRELISGLCQYPIILVGSQRVLAAPN